MIDMVRKILGKDAGEKSAGNEKLRHQRVLVATCALLLEMAYIDGSFSGEERERIVGILKDEYGLDAGEAASVMEAAQAEVKKSIDLWQFTSLINEYYSEQEKERVIEMIWTIVFVDGKLDKYEDYLVHNLSDLLHLDHSSFIEAKLRARRALENKDKPE